MNDKEILDRIEAGDAPQEKTIDDIQFRLKTIEDRHASEDQDKQSNNYKRAFHITLLAFAVTFSWSIISAMANIITILHH